MLIKCPECELQVSDKALSCPHCGYPIDKNIKRRVSHTNRRKRLPNGFGQITEIKSKNLRKPFRAMIPAGKDANGRPISKLLKPEAYFESYNDAYAALVEYNRNPYDLDSDITVKELYSKWTDNYFKTLKSQSSVRTIVSAWKYCSSVENINASSLRARHIKCCMDSVESPNMKSRIKSLFNLMLDYAVEYEIVDRNYARTFNISSDIIDDAASTKRDHISFTDQEMDVLWSNINDPYVQVVLIQCYMGWRPQELGLIELKNVDLTNGTIIGGMKTEAGTDRIVPIHSKIRSIIEQKYKEAENISSCYLLPCNGMLTYDKYKVRFANVIKSLNLIPEHRPHDCRKQFITMAKKNGVDEYAIKRIVGHSITDLTEKVYTDRTIDWLKTEIEKIK